MKKILLLLALLGTVATGRAQYTNVYIGTTANDGSGDTLRVAFSKINWNMDYFNSLLYLNLTNLPAISNQLASIQATNLWLLTWISNNAPLIDEASAFVTAGNYVTNTGGGYFLNGTFTGTFTGGITGSNLYFDSGDITSDGSGNITAGSYFGSLKDSGYSTGTATYVPTANGDGTWTWAAPTGGSGGQMNFDSGLITSDGSGNISTSGSYENPSVDGRFSVIGTYQTHAAYATYNGAGVCAIDFYTFGGGWGNSGGGGFESDTPALTWTFADQGNYEGLAEFSLSSGGSPTAGQTVLVSIGSGGYDQTSGFGGMAVGADWSHGGFSMPDNGLIVEGNSGFGQQYPAYPVDVSGDLNLTGVFRMNGNAVIQNDSGGNGGTTLMLNASDNGSPMYIHVTSAGVITATSSP